MLQYLLKTQLHHSDKSQCRQKFGQHRRAGWWEWQEGHWRCSRGNKNQNELVIAVVKNGRNVYLQPVVKLPLVRFMPTLGLQQPAPFLPRAHQYPPHYIRIPQMDDISDSKFGEYKMSIGKLGRKVGCNVQPFSSPHVQHVHMGVCVCAVINARVCVCAAHPLHLHTLQILSGSHHPQWRVINTLVTPSGNGSKYALSYKVRISASLAPASLTSLWVMLLI